MSAESSTLIPSDGSLSLRTELAAVLTAFERATGLFACFRPMSDRWNDIDGEDLVARPFAEHRSAFCQAVKARAYAACAKCDSTDLPAACSTSDGLRVEPFVRTCHAGIDEVLLPLWSEGVLVAVLFIGQFTREAAPRSGDSVRLLNVDEIDQVSILMFALRSYLADVLARLETHRHGHSRGRRGAIEAYVRETLASGPTLTELAERLSLSRSRASHVVREETGHPFQHLIEDRRITVAKDLLTGSDATIGWIARQTGFTDDAYFCRYFKRKTGSTPTAFRRQHRRAISV